MEVEKNVELTRLLVLLMVLKRTMVLVAESTVKKNLSSEGKLSMITLMEMSLQLIAVSEGTKLQICWLSA